MSNDLIFYRTPEGDRKIEVVFQSEGFWLTQKALADLFGVGVPAVSKHLNNIFESGELLEDSAISKMETATVNTRLKRKINDRKEAKR